MYTQQEGSTETKKNSVHKNGMLNQYENQSENEPYKCTGRSMVLSQ